MRNKYLVILAIVAWLGLSSFKLFKDVEIDLDKDPLEMHGDSIELKANLIFPVKSVHKKEILWITPVLGNVQFKSIMFQGENAEGNARVVLYKEANSFTYRDKVKYDPSMYGKRLQIHVKKVKKEDTIELSYELGNGLKLTPYLMINDEYPIFASSGYQHMAPKKHETVIYFDKGKPKPKKGEWDKKGVVDLFSLIKRGIVDKDPSLKIERLEIRSYTSPEGEIEKNKSNTVDNAQYVADYIRKKYPISTELVEIYAGGEDWQGFKNAVEESDHRDDILKLLMNKFDPNEMKKEYPEVEKILESLRRTHIILHYKEKGRDKKEMFEMAFSDPSQLSANELLYVVENTIDKKGKMTILMNASSAYPDDWRIYNNLACLHMRTGNIISAKDYLERAENKQEHPTIYANMATIYRWTGEIFRSKVIHKSLIGDSLINYNKSLLAIQDGQYEAALWLMGNHFTFNKALCYTLMNKHAEAIDVLNKIPATAETNYLRAVIAAREENRSEVIIRIKLVMNEDYLWGPKFRSDAEFWKYWEDPDFLELTK